MPLDVMLCSQKMDSAIQPVTLKLAGTTVESAAPSPQGTNLLLPKGSSHWNITEANCSPVMLIRIVAVTVALTLGKTYDIKTSSTTNSSARRATVVYPR